MLFLLLGTHFLCKQLDRKTSPHERMSESPERNKCHKFKDSQEIMLESPELSHPSPGHGWNQKGRPGSYSGSSSVEAAYAARGVENILMAMTRVGTGEIGSIPGRYLRVGGKEGSSRRVVE